MALNRYEMFVVGAPHTLTLQIYDTDGDPIELDGNCTYEILDGSGGTVDSGVATNSTATTGVYTVDDIVADDVDVWSVHWSGFLGGTAWSDVTYAEPVGNVLFTENQFRAFAGDLFSSESTFSDDTVRSARDAATEQLEQWTNRSWIPRYCRAQFAGTNRYELMFSDGYARTSEGKPLNRPGRNRDVRQILSASVDGSSVSTSDLTVLDGILHRTAYWPLATNSNRLNITVEYEYGQPWITDGVDRIAMLLAKDRLRETIVSDRATSFTDDLGTYRFETPGRAGNVSNIPEVNEWVKSHRQQILVG